MKRLAALTLQGLVAVLPVALTIYLVYWLLMTIEAMAGAALRAVLPADWYFAGLGVISGLVLLTVIGVLVNAYAVRHLLRLGDALLSRIPLVKSVHGAIQDVLRAFSIANKQQADSVVLVRIGENMQLLGFVTSREPARRLRGAVDQSVVGVYLPMSYQLGGYTVYLPADQLEAVDLSVEEAMRIAVTGGVQNPEGGA
jgi:uncharacterized membrane protein